MILDYMYTYGGPELFMLFTFIIVTPLLYVLLLRRLRWPYRVVSVLGLWVAALAISFTDVYLIARKARMLCAEEAGLHVYKTTESDGLLGLHNLEDWVGYGFTFVEYISPGKRYYREYMESGLVRTARVDELISQYELEVESQSLSETITKNREAIRERKTSEILGETVAFTFYPGWLDRSLLGSLGFTWTPPRCDGNYPPRVGKQTLYYDDLVKAVIRSHDDP